MEWRNISDEDFAKAVQGNLDRGIKPEQFTEIFGIHPSLVERYANGTSVPGVWPLKAIIVDRINALEPTA